MMEIDLATVNEGFDDKEAELGAVNELDDDKEAELEDDELDEEKTEGWGAEVITSAISLNASALRALRPVLS